MFFVTPARLRWQQYQPVLFLEVCDVWRDGEEAIKQSKFRVRAFKVLKAHTELESRGDFNKERNVVWFGDVRRKGLELDFSKEWRGLI
jgi:hypothetical protein